MKLSLGLASKPAPALPNSVLWLAKDLGYYEREGLDVTLQELDGTPTVIAAMIAGDLDVGNIGTDQLVKLAAQKSVDMRAINSSDARQYFLIESKDSIGTIQDLKGKTFGVAKVGSLDDTMTRLVLQAKGFDPTQMTFAGIGAPDARAQALVAGRVDATTMSLGTWVSIQHEKGLKTLVNADDYYAAAPINLKVNAATSKLIQSNPEVLRRFTAAIMKASRSFAEDQNAWVDAMLKRRPDLKRDDLVELWPQFKNAWAVNGLFNLEQYQKTEDFLYKTPDFKDVPPAALSAWTDTQFVDPCSSRSVWTRSLTRPAGLFRDAEQLQGRSPCRGLGCPQKADTEWGRRLVRSRLGGALLAASLLAACGGTAAPSAKPVATMAVSYPEGGAHLPLWYAKDKGIFARNGLNVDLRPLGGGSPAMAALTSGQTQVADITGSVIAAADAGGADVLALATLDPVYPYVLEANADIKSPADLKGQAIAVRAFGDATDVAARVALQKLGLTPDKDVRLIEVNSENARVAATLAKQACCTVAQPQDRPLLESNGFHQLFDFSQLQGTKNAQGVIGVTRAYASGNSTAVQAFMDSLVQAIAAEKADKPGSLALIKKYLKLDTEAGAGTPTPSEASADQIANVLYDYFVGQVIPANPVATADQFTDGIAVAAEKNAQLRGFDMSRYIDGSFLEQAEKRPPSA